MLNTLTRNPIASAQWVSNVPSAASTVSASTTTSGAHLEDRYVSSGHDGAGLYSPRMFASTLRNGSAAATDEGNGYGGRLSTTAGPRHAAETYDRHGDDALSLTDRADVGRLISRSPQIDDLSTDDDQNRCGGAAIFNAMLLDGNHTANSDAIRATLGDHITPEQNIALKHMRAGRMTPHEAAELQDAIFDHAEDLNGTENDGLNLRDLRRTVAELREHGAFPNTRELNFRRETTDSATSSSHWTVSSRTTHGTHFADSWPQANGYARVGGAGEAAFTPWDAEDRVMEDSLTVRPGAGSAEFQETVAGPNGEWRMRDYDRAAARRDADAVTTHDLPESF